MQIRPLLLHGTSLTLLSLLAAGCGGSGPEESPASQPPAEEGAQNPADQAPPAPATDAGKDDGAPAGDAPISIEDGNKAIGGGSDYPVFEDGADLVQTMYAYIDKVQARPDVKENRLKVQHILIGVGPRFGGRLPADAEKRAAEVLKELADAKGANFDELVKKHTNDAYPGIYTMILTGNPDLNNGIFRRDQMVAAFGDVGWKLKVGQVGISPYDPKPPTGKGTSYYGLHIIKRVE